jgi:hypothetical protein
MTAWFEEAVMRYGPRFAAIGLVCAGLLWAQAALAAETIVGSVLAVRGEVFRDEAKQSPLAAKAPVYLGDTIVSGAGKAKIGLNDGTVISVGENTRVRLAMYQSTSNGFTTRLHAWTGALRLLVARVTSGGHFEIETETAIAAVRGTDWLMDVTENMTGVAIISGVVAVSSPGKPETSVVLDTPGHGTDVARGAAPTTPHPWAAPRFAKLLERASFE